MARWLNYGIKIFITLGVLSAVAFGSIISTNKYVEKELKRNLSKVSALAATTGDLQFGEIHSDILGMAVEVQDVTFKPYNTNEKVSVDSIKIDQIDPLYLTALARHQKAPMRSGRLTISGFVLPPSALNKEQQKFLQVMGYSEISLSMAVGVKMDPAEETFDITDFWIEGYKMGRLSLQASFGNFPIPTQAEAESFSQNPAALLAYGNKFSAVILNSASIKYEDQSLISRVRYAAYKETGVDPIARIAYQAPANDREPASNGIHQRMVIGVEEFLKDPKYISFNAKPLRPVPLLRLAADTQESPDQVANILNFTIDVNGTTY